KLARERLSSVKRLNDRRKLVVTVGSVIPGDFTRDFGRGRPLGQHRYRAGAVFAEVVEDADDIIVGEAILRDDIGSRGITLLKQIIEVGPSGKVVERSLLERQGQRYALCIVPPEVAFGIGEAHRSLLIGREVTNGIIEAVEAHVEIHQRCRSSTSMPRAVST